MNFIDKLEEWVTMKSHKLVGVLWGVSLILITIGFNIWVIKWILRLLGVL